MIVLKPDLVSVVTAHMVYFGDFARFEIFQENVREVGVGRGQFYTGANGLSLETFLSGIQNDNEIELITKPSHWPICIGV